VMMPKRFCLVFVTALLSGILLNPTADADNNTNIVDTAPNIVGEYVTGTRDELQIINDGELSCTNEYVSGYIGWGGNYNSALVSGPGSVWSNLSTLIVGGYSHNSLVISNGGMVVDGSGNIGNGGTGYQDSALVTGPGSVWLNQGDLSVGWYGAADLMSNSLVVSNGGAVSDVNGWVGDDANGNSALVSGPGSVWSNSSNLYMQEAGGFLVIGNGGKVIAVGAILINGNSNNVVVAGSGSMLNGQNGIAIGTNGVTGNSLTVNGGAVMGSEVTVAPSNSLALNGGTLVASNGVVVCSGALLKGTGTIYADITLAGTLAPGALTNFGNLTLQSSAVLQFELGGTAQGSGYNFVLVTNGLVTLNGLLRVGFINGFATNVLNSDTFTLLTAGTVNGAFDDVLSGQRLTTDGDEGSFLVAYSGNDLVLSDYEVVPEPATRGLLVMGIGALLARRRLGRRNVSG